MFTKMRLQQGFTLMEIMIVVIIVGIIAGLSLPNYYTATERTRMQDAMTKLRMIHKAQEMHHVKYDKFFPDAPFGVNNMNTFYIADINQYLALNIVENGFVYQCVGSYGAYMRTFNSKIYYICDAIREGGAYTITLDNNVLSSSNPICTNGNKNCP
jgi:prepilin-type N-terminal cleavage/methylation domain-containing protein